MSSEWMEDDEDEYCQEVEPDDMESGGTPPPAAYPDPTQVEDGGPPPDLVPCDVCGRNFAADRLGRHMKICEKQSKKKRKVFGESAERLKLQEKLAEEEAKAKAEKEKKKAVWKAQHEAFQNALKTAAAIQRGEAPPMDLVEPEDDRISCPHCGRKFNADVAERHIPKCLQIKAKPNAVGATQKRPSQNRISSPASADSDAAAAAKSAALMRSTGGGGHRASSPTPGDKQQRPPMGKGGANSTTASPSKMRKVTPPPKRPTATAGKVR